MKVLHDIDNDNDCTLTSLITTKFLGSHSSLWRSKHEWWEREWHSSITLTLHFFCGDCDDSGSRIINRGFGLVMGGSINLSWSHMVTWGFYKSPWVNWSIFFPMYFSQMFTMKPIDETMLRTTPMITENWHWRSFIARPKVWRSNCRSSTAAFRSDGWDVRQMMGVPRSFHESQLWFHGIWWDLTVTLLYYNAL